MPFINDMLAANEKESVIQSYPLRGWSAFALLLILMRLFNPSKKHTRSR